MLAIIDQIDRVLDHAAIERDFSRSALQTLRIPDRDFVS